jgi:hypothetical protein
MILAFVDYFVTVVFALVALLGGRPFANGSDPSANHIAKAEINQVIT